jgi:hypothetical protein
MERGKSCRFIIYSLIHESRKKASYSLRCDENGKHKSEKYRQKNEK